MSLLIRETLAKAYQIAAMLQLDDHTYTHLSAKASDASFYIYPFGLCFAEVTATSLLEVSFDGQVLSGQEAQYNETGYRIHGSIYRARADVNAVFHLHTCATIAVSALKEGLLPASQWALHFYEKIAYHAYDSLVLSGTQGEQLIRDLGALNIMFLRNHGTLMLGKTIQEAMFYTYHLEQACKTQCALLAMQRPFVMPSKDVCQKTVSDLLSFEKNLGVRDWQAWERLLVKKDQGSVLQDEAPFSDKKAAPVCFP